MISGKRKSLDCGFGFICNVEVFLDIGEGKSVDVRFFPPFDSEFSKERIRHLLKSDSEEWVGGLEYFFGVDWICWSEPVPPFVEPSCWVEKRYGFGYSLDCGFGFICNVEVFLDIGEGKSVDVRFFPPFDSEFSKERIRHLLKSDSEGTVFIEDSIVEGFELSKVYWFGEWGRHQVLLMRIEEDILLMLSKGLELKFFLEDVVGF
ncbi:hypothetical protein F2Q69_00022786 [Brassica cretica]|uniref:Uncharacterized protein n=1 Tax=Brassica cretica TaxID=69181 RepID=A0A8S9QDX4_BRACR|nr:hypothetical protein F2Q69_00022786 [Brassica cretica]